MIDYGRWYCFPNYLPSLNPRPQSLAVTLPRPLIAGLLCGSFQLIYFQQKCQLALCQPRLLMGPLGIYLLHPLVTFNLHQEKDFLFIKTHDVKTVCTNFRLMHFAPVEPQFNAQRVDFYHGMRRSLGSFVIQYLMVLLLSTGNCM